MDTNPHFALIARAISWLADNQAEQPSLSALAAALEVSPHHLQRTFQAWAGVSPKQFLKSLTRQAAMQRLVAGDTVLDASMAVGLSGPGRLHDLLITTEALTPGEIRARGAGVRLAYGQGGTPFGEAVVCWSARGLSFLGFCETSGAGEAIRQARETWPNAAFEERPEEAQAWLDLIFNECREKPLRLWLHGSPFQLKVWEALLQLPEGATVTYGQLAKLIGRPGAARAVGSAVGANPLTWVIPCHRVIRQLGEIGEYRWGSVTKRAMIGREACRTSNAPPSPAAVDAQVGS
jgi:AraC family transcriptional regulator of adaptative response/methylated-DNA-[protein]-cysteine methyltransferase